MPDTADHTALVARPMRLSAILDYIDVVRFCERHDGIHIARPACEVNTDDRPGARREHGLDRLGSNVLTFAIDIREYRNGPGIDDTAGRRQKGPRSNYDFVTGANAQDLECHVERKRAI